MSEHRVDSLLNRVWARVLMWPIALVCALAACSEVERVNATATLVRVEIDAELLTATRALRVRTALEREGGWTPRNDKRYDVAQLRWPVEIVVVPRAESEADGVFEFVAEALDEGGQVLAQARARTGFVLRSQRELVLRLARCGDRPLGFVCEPDADCFGPGCQSCVGASCADTPFIEPARLTRLDPRARPDGGATDAGDDPTDDAGDTPNLDAGDSPDHDAEAPESDAGEPDAAQPGCAPGSGPDADGGACTDIDECARGLDDCDDEPRACINLAGSQKFACACPKGYHGDGRGAQGCDDVDECAEQTDQCEASATCNNSVGSYACGACQAGYHPGAGGACVDIDECASNNGGCDTSPTATCRNVDGRPNTCTCPGGYSGNGVGADGCANIDDCSPGACQNGGRCVDGLNAFSCACVAPYTGDRCELQVCGSVSISSRADVESHARCVEVTGNLVLQPSFTTLSATDLPNLRTVRGNLTINPPTEVPQQITLQALTTVGGSIQISGLPDGPRAIRLPSLTTVGTSTGPKSLVQIEGNMNVLEAPALRTIYGDVSISTYLLCTADFRAVQRVTGDLMMLSPMPYVAYGSVSALLGAVEGVNGSEPVGCCRGSDTYQCGGFDVGICSEFSCP